MVFKAALTVLITIYKNGGAPLKNKFHNRKISYVFCLLKWGFSLKPSELAHQMANLGVGLIFLFKRSIKMLEVYTQNTTVPEDTAIPFNNTTIQKGSTVIKTAPTTIQFNRIGVYMVSFDASASLSEGTTADNIVCQLYKNGSSQIQAVTSATSSSTTDIAHLSFNTLVQVPQNNTCNCATSPTTIQILNTGAAANFAQADLVVTKIC